MLPTECKAGIKLPARFFTSPVDALRPPEEVLSFIPGECWALQACCFDNRERGREPPS